MYSLEPERGLSAAVAVFPILFAAFLIVFFRFAAALAALARLAEFDADRAVPVPYPLSTAIIYSSGFFALHLTRFGYFPDLFGRLRSEAPS
jgi:hypothetical protein